MELVETLIEDARWDAFGLPALAERAARATLATLEMPVAGFMVSLMGCDDDRIAGLNADFRGKPTPTNVLSWPSEERAAETPGGMPELPEPGPVDDPESLGDIAIAFDTCAREAEAAAKPMHEHVSHLVVHRRVTSGAGRAAGHDRRYDLRPEPEGLFRSAAFRLPSSFGQRRRWCDASRALKRRGRRAWCPAPDAGG